MGSRNGARPVILRARRSFEPIHWQDQTLANAYRLVCAQSQIECRAEQPAGMGVLLNTSELGQGLSHGEVTTHEPIEMSACDLWSSLGGAAGSGTHHR